MKTAVLREYTTFALSNLKASRLIISLELKMCLQGLVGRSSKLNLANVLHLVN